MPARKRRKRRTPEEAAKSKVCPKCKGPKSPRSKRCKQCKVLIGGRPPTVWSDKDWKTFESFCLLTNKKHRVAVAMGIDEKTIDRMCWERYGISFSEYLGKRFHNGNFALLSSQFEKAQAGNPAMLIWLGKNRLGQSDNPEPDDDDVIKSSEYRITLKDNQ